ncbi:ester cyclase [Actinopolyspora sp. H202]|uniref:ester cyclase n=1 Tax=Actinopolyspora sp. H202 TaxID=1500456 RepID=UPI003EE48D07
MRETAKNLYRRWLHELWAGDHRVAREIVSQDFAIHHGEIRPGTGRELSGPAGAAKLVELGRQPFERLRFTLEVGPIVEGDLLSARWIGNGTYAGGMPGATAAPGTEVEFAGNDILRFHDGRFVAYWVCSDGTWLLKQLGAGG